MLQRTINALTARRRSNNQQARRYGGCKGTLPQVNESDEPRFLNLRDGGNLPDEPTPIWPFLLIISCLIVFLLLSFEKVVG